MLAFAVLAAVVGLEAQRPPASVRPAIRTSIDLSKTRFVRGERIWMWLEVAAAERGQLIGDEHMTNRRVIVTRPDGSQHVEEMGDSVHVDGMTRFGTYRGGWSLREATDVGRYVLIFEVAGQQSAPVSFTIEGVDLLDRITGEFVFPAPFVVDSPEAWMTLVIRNQSGETIRFPDLSMLSMTLSGRVGIALKHLGDLRWSRSISVSGPILRAATGAPPSMTLIDTFKWGMADVIEVTVPPAGAYEVRIPLRDVWTSVGSGTPGPIPSGDYEVVASTELQVLVGEPDGPWKDFSPVRLNVTTIAKGVKPGSIATGSRR